MSLFAVGGDALLTACYMISHMPSFILNNQTLDSILYLQQNLYFVPLGVFGGKDKLIAKSLKCVFLDYYHL